MSHFVRCLFQRCALLATVCSFSSVVQRIVAGVVMILLWGCFTCLMLPMSLEVISSRDRR